MKKKITLLLSGLCPLCMLAADVAPGITFNMADGNSISVVISKLQSIKFADGVILANMKDHSQQSFDIDDITSIIFEDVATAIKALTSDVANGIVTITDVSGRTVYSGKAAHVPSQDKLSAGIYVITANGKSCKLMVK